MPDYTVAIVHQQPTQAGPPTWTELHHITDPTGLSYTDQITPDEDATVTTDLSLWTPEALNAFAALLNDDIAEKPNLELWIWRDVLPVFQGPIDTHQVQTTGSVISLQARGASSYLADMFIRNGYTAVTDQYTAVADLVDQWQDVDWHHCGIDTSTVGSSGQPRDINYPAAENHVVAQRVSDLGARIGGFDWWIALSTDGPSDTTSRTLMLATSRGTDKTATVTLDSRGIVNPQLHISTTRDRLVAVARGVSGELTPVLVTNQDLLQSFGGRGGVVSFDSLTVQQTLIDHTQQWLDERGQPLVQPNPQIIPVAGADPNDFGPGDIVEWAYQVGPVPILMHRRVASKTVSVEDNGNETVTVGFI